LFWRKQKSHKDKASYLHKLLETGGPGAILTVFKNEIPFGLLGEFLISVSSEKEQFDSKILEMLLTTLAQTGRFNLSLSFLSSSEKDCLKEIVTYLEKLSVDSTALKELYDM